MAQRGVLKPEQRKKGIQVQGKFSVGHQSPSRVTKVSTLEREHGKPKDASLKGKSMCIHPSAKCQCKYSEGSLLPSTVHQSPDWKRRVSMQSSGLV